MCHKKILFDRVILDQTLDCVGLGHTDFLDKTSPITRVHSIECGAERLEHDVAQSTFYLPGFYD